MAEAEEMLCQNEATEEQRRLAEQAEAEERRLRADGAHSSDC